ncbi:MAG: sigma 54-interacting transcriptional regulator [Deltaproteobacteria bacterium]|nr:sigma 54-interacting transcriptional regulator [Deltaproteobacteria bacterium]
MILIPMNKFLRNDQSKQKVYTWAGKWALVFGVFYLTSLYSYLLFHTFAEIFSTAVALAIFLLLWNVRRSMDNSYLLLVGVAYLFVGALDLLHTLAYKGMGVFGAYEEDLPTQLWIGVRYMQSISLLIAPFFLGKRLNLKFVVAAYTLASSLLLGAIFYWEVFPVCFVPGKGLTPFKVLSEYIISVILLAAIALLAKKRDRFDPPVFRYLVLSIAFTIFSELSFTLYVDVYGFFSLIGHFLKIIAFYCIYKAIVEQGVAKPLEVLFRNLSLSETALREERDFTSAVLSTAGAMVVVLDREGRIIRFNRACEQLTGYSFKEVEGNIFWNLFVPPEDVEPVKAVFERLKMGDFPDEHENHWVAKDGTRHLIHWSNTGLPDPEGEIQFIIGTGIDITEGRAAQDALKTAHDHLETQVQVRTAELVKTCDQLRDSEEKYRIVASNTYDWEWWIGPDGKFIYISPSCKEITLHEGKEFEADPELLLKIVHPEDVSSFQRHLVEIEDKRLDGEVEFRILRPDGSVRWLAHSCKAVLDDKGVFLGRRGSNRDITERKKAEESVLNSLAEIRVLKERLEAENIYLRQEMKLKSRFSHIIGESNAIKYVLYRAEHVAPTSTTVLVLGETGTGKDLIASAIHQRSPRKDKPLITLNCAALPANLIESELFGREKGAFTGADARQIGRFELADGSTLCLDEIGELPLELQAKLLRVIQHGEFERLGSSRAVKVDVRIVATTNRNLEEEVRNGRFRQDLYYRLNVFPITIPPLRQRKEDIPLLVEAFLEKYARDHGKEFTSIQSEVMKVLQEYDWPGNIRELQNVIERAVIMCHGPVLQLADKLNNTSPGGSSSLRTLEETEREHILKTLQETGWRINGKNGAAAILGLNPSTLRARMHKLGIHRPEVKA